MTLPFDRGDREYTKFGLTTNDKTAVRIIGESTDPIPVYITNSTAATEVSNYSEVTAVASAIETDVITYTVPVATTFALKRIQVSGSNVAEYKVKVNAVVIDKARTYFGASLNHMFEYTQDSSDGLSYPAGTVIKVTVIHSRPDTGDFNARIQGSES